MKHAFAFVSLLLLFSCSQQEELAAPQSVDPQPGVFNGTEGGPIDLAIARSWQKNWQTAHPEQPKGLFYGREILLELLAKEGSMGIRFDPGYDEEGKLHLLLYSTDKNGNNLLEGSIQVVNDADECPPNYPDPGIE